MKVNTRLQDAQQLNLLNAWCRLLLYYSPCQIIEWSRFFPDYFTELWTKITYLYHVKSGGMWRIQKIVITGLWSSHILFKTLILIHLLLYQNICSSKMATTPVKKVQRKEKVWICGSTERRHASRACQKDHSRSWWHVQQEISAW